MILPIGHEDGVVLRAPRVTLGIAALCVMAHLWVASRADADRELERSWSAAVEFALAHPELSRPEELVPAELGPLAAEEIGRASCRERDYTALRAGAVT